MAEDRDYYCSMKFRYLKVDLESNTTYNCHAASPHRIDFAWLRSNPGQLFNTDINVRERAMMLNNQRNSSCEQNCWFAEDRGATSPRIYQNGQSRTHDQVTTEPEILDITVGGDCNLTCSYCCKEFSSSWRRDIDRNGPYPIDQDHDRYVLTDKDKILLKVSQPELKASKNYQLLMEEAKRMGPRLKLLEITGGEPLLDNTLIDFIKSQEFKDCDINLFTGLGVNINRFRKMCEALKDMPNLQFKISAESTGRNLEFNRYGTSWQDFLDKINLLRDQGIGFKFHSTISNLTIFGFREFYQTFGNNQIDLTFAYSPRMMSPFVLDDDSKTQLETEFESLPEQYRQRLIGSMQNTPSEQDRLDIAAFVKEFVSRRSDLGLDLFPKTFLNWIGV